MKKRKYLGVLFLLFLVGISSFSFQHSIKNTKVLHNSIEHLAYQETSTDDNKILEQHILYALDQLDDSMTDHEKSYLLATFVQDGNVYSLKDVTGSQYYESVFLNHMSVCAGFNDAFRILNNAAGLSCEIVTSYKASHAWNICNLDGEWSYLDATKDGGSTSYARLDFTAKFDSRSSIPSSAASMYNFSDAIFRVNQLFNLGSTSFPEGVESTANFLSTSSRPYYDETYRYYIDDTYQNGWSAALYRENRSTKQKEKLVDTFYRSEAVGLVKDRTYLYYVGTDKSLYSMNTSTKVKTKLVNVSGTQEVRSVFVQDGNIKYALYDSSKSTTEAKVLKALDTWPSLKTYTLGSSYNYNLEYIEGEKGVSILRAVGKNGATPSGTLSLPDTINGKPVVRIADYAFKETSFSGSIKLPNQLKDIGYRAFYYSKNFSGTLTLPSTLKSIQAEAFYMVPISGKLEVPDSVTYIGYDAFRECSLTSLKLGKGLKYISEGAFAWNRDLDGVVEIPEGVEYVGESAFRYCFKLKAIILPSTLKEVDEKFVASDRELEEIIIKSENIESMGFDDSNAKVYLHKNTNTSSYADKNNISYKDLVQTITLDSNTLTGNVGDTLSLSYTLTPKYYFDSTVTLTSDNQQVAKIENGKVRLLKSGDANITITTKSGATAKVKVTVTDIRLTLNYSEYQMDKSTDKLKLKATLTSGETPQVTWESTNTKIVKVDSSGNVTPVGAGFASVVARSNGKTASCLIFANLPVQLSDGRKGFVGDLNRDGLLNSEDSSMMMDLYYGNDATSDDVLLGDINRDGSINILDATMLIDAYNANYFHSGIYKSIESVTLNTTSLNLKVGAKQTLTATIAPKDTTDSEKLTWQSSNQQVATVSTTGLVQARGVGTANITVKTSNNKTAVARVIVTTDGKVTFQKGDVNIDTFIDVLDAREILYMTVGRKKITTDALLRGDMDENKKIEANDAVEIMRLYVGKK